LIRAVGARARTTVKAAFVVAVFTMVAGPTAADCINCVRDDDAGWVCKLTASNGGDTCQTVGGNACTVTGTCVYLPPPQPPPPPPLPGPHDTKLASFFGAYLDLGPSDDCYPLCSNFPASVPLAEAFDFASIRLKAANLAGKPASEVAIRSRAYFGSTSPAFAFNPGTAGVLVDGGSEGFIIRRDLATDGSARVRVCKFSVGQPAEAVSDQTLGDSGTLLVRLPLNGRDVVLAFKTVMQTTDDFESMHVADQAAWASDFEANRSGIPWEIAVGHASTDCQ
jgi:hypothetical protein